MTKRMLALLLPLALVASCDEDDGATPSAEAASRLPRAEHCDPVREWNDDLVALEQRMLEALDARRAEGRHCGPRGSFAPAPPLRRSGALTCAARLHALDMAEQGFVDHEGSDDSTPWARMRRAGYLPATADEVIAAADLTPQDIIDQIWLSREGSCSALSATAYTDVGIGVALPFDEDDAVGLRWTIVLAKPIE